MAVFDVTIDNTKVSVSETDFPVLIDLSDMPAAFWSTVTSGGGDIRCYESDGTTELAREVVSCDTTGETGELWVLVSSLSASVDTVIKVDVDGARSDYAVGATYGRNAVWASYVAVYHGDSTSDATGNGGTLSGVGTGSKSVGSATAKIGTSFSFAEDGGYQTATAGGSLASGGKSTLQSWVRRSSDPYAGNFDEPLINYATTGDNHAVGIAGIGSLDNKLLTFTTGGNTSATTSGAALSISTWYKIESVFDQAGNTVTHYLNGSQDSQTTSYTDNSAASSDITIGIRSSDLLDGIIGNLDEVRVKDDGLDSDWISTEYNNQNSPSTFYSIVAAGGGTIFCSVGNFTFEGQSVGFTASNNIAAAHGQIDVEGQAIALTTQETIPAAHGQISLDGQQVTITASELIAAGHGQITLDGQAVDVIEQQTVTAEPGTFTLDGQAVGLIVDSIISAGHGTITLDGQPVNVIAGTPIIAERGEFNLVGQAIGLVAHVNIPVDAGEFNLDGQSIGFITDSAIPLAHGYLQLDGQIVNVLEGAQEITGWSEPVVIVLNDKALEIVLDDKPRRIIQ